MKIFLRDVKAEGIDVHYAIPVEEIGLTKDDYLRFIEPLEVKAHIELVDNVLLSNTKVKSRYKSFCARTFVELERDWSDEFILDFTVTKATEFVELDDDIRQEVILGLPVRILCDAEMQKEAAAIEEKENLDELHVENQRTQQPFKNLKINDGSTYGTK